MSVPSHATQSQIEMMNRKAEELMARDGIKQEPVAVEPVEQQHPMLAHHEEPSQEVREEEVEYADEQEEVEGEVLATPQETSQQMNFRLIKERAERAERERDEAMKYAMSFQKPQQQTKQPEPEEDYSDIGLDDDGLAEGKHLKKMLKEMREIKKELQSYKAKSIEDTVELKLKSQYPDLNKVLTHENLQQLTSINPELADMISQTPDMYKRAKLAYDMVRQYGIYKDTPSYDTEKAVAQKNAAKPRPLASVSPQQSDSPLSKANAFANAPLSKEIKDQLHREMIAAMRGR